MLIGAPKEIKDNEFRVGLTPATVAELTHRGHGVIIEKSAGVGSGLTDDEYRNAGAEIVDTPQEIFARADMVVKVKEPQAAERKMRSAACGSFTLTTMSARANISCGVSTISAPALRYSSSVRPDPTPADFSIMTPWPRCVSSATVAGVKPTRNSLSLISFGAPINILYPSDQSEIGTIQSKYFTGVPWGPAGFILQAVARADY